MPGAMKDSSTLKTCRLARDEEVVFRGAVWVCWLFGDRDSNPGLESFRICGRLSPFDSDAEMKMIATASTSNAQLRKIKKPLIERRRRERINECLTQLKTLVLEAMNRDESCYSKMEKADILEMTVAHLKNIQRHPISSSSASVASSQEDAQKKYLMGFNECAKEVGNYLSSVEELAAKVGAPLMKHLISCIESMQRYKVGAASSDESCGVGGHPENPKDYPVTLTSLLRTLADFPGSVPLVAGTAVPVTLNLESYSAMLAFCDGFRTVGKLSSSALLSPASSVTETCSGSISSMISSPGVHKIDSEQEQGLSSWRTPPFSDEVSASKLLRLNMPVRHSIFPISAIYSTDSQISRCFASPLAAPFPASNGWCTDNESPIKNEAFPPDSPSHSSIWRPW